MSYTYKTTISTTDGTASLSGSSNEVGGNKSDIDTTFPANSANVAQSMSFAVNSLQSIHLVSDKGLVLKTNGTGTNEIQSLSISGTPTGGSFALGFNGAVTSPIAYNANAATVQSSLRAIAGIGNTGVNCGGGPLPGTPVTCTFAGTLANTNVPALVPDNGGALTGGTTPAVAVATTNAGLPSNVITLQPGIPLVWRRSAGYFACPFTVDVVNSFVSCNAAARLQAKILTT